MAARAVLTHTSWDGAPCTMYTEAGCIWYGCGEAIGDTTASVRELPARQLPCISLWKSSPEHDALIMSETYNYIGIGVSYRSANHTTYASILFLEGPDSTRPIRGAGPQSDSSTAAPIHWGWTA